MSPLRFAYLWILLAVLSTPITLDEGLSRGLAPLCWMLLKIGMGVLFAGLVATPLSWQFAPSRKPAQP